MDKSKEVLPASGKAAKRPNTSAECGAPQTRKFKEGIGKKQELSQTLLCPTKLKSKPGKWRSQEKKGDSQVCQKPP